MTPAEGQSPVHLARGTLRFLQQGVAEHETPLLISPLCASQGGEHFSCFFVTLVDA
jgi:hypothetical protein